MSKSEILRGAAFGAMVITACLAMFLGGDNARRIDALEALHEQAGAGIPSETETPSEPPQPSRLDLPRPRVK